MRESEAYPCGRDYAQRATAVYAPGARVEVGAPFRSGGHYIPEGTEGFYYVVAAMDNGDYKLCRHDFGPDDDEWKIIIHASRLSPAYYVTINGVEHNHCGHGRPVDTRTSKKKFATTHT
ncbi:MAG: hypothetical protein ACE1ZA_05565 [Pseudomonadales bacterium]